jgi:DUF971 family protein
MKPLDIQQIGDQLAIKWDDSSETYLSLETMRRHCPCASCHGEADILGNVYKGPDKPLAPNAFKLLRLNNVGGYALNPQWADGHNTGLYSFEYLQKLEKL